MQITIDPNAGYCFGVKNAVGQAEAILSEDVKLYSLGHLIHNSKEVNRLLQNGLQVISHDEFSRMRNCRVLIRAHGEPPSTYETAFRNNITLIDATCPIVKHLQSNLRERVSIIDETNSQVAIYGKHNHPEVIGLTGHTGGIPLVIEDETDIQKIDPGKDVHLYAQTTMDPDGLKEIASKITAYLAKSQPGSPKQVIVHHTICRQVTNRIKNLKKFAASNDVILFISGKNSSNGQFLFGVCNGANPQSYHIENVSEIVRGWFDNVEKLGITGATSTPVWQLNAIRDYVSSIRF